MPADVEAGARPAVLLVDGDVLVRHPIAAYLRDCGYDVVEAATSDEARRLVEQAKVDLEAVLCDAGIQGSLNAFELRRWLGQARPGLTVLLAGNVAASAQAAASLCEAEPLLGRPYDPQALLARISQLSARRDRRR